MKYKNKDLDQEIQVIKENGKLRLIFNDGTETEFIGKDSDGKWWFNNKYSCKYNDEKLFLSEGQNIGSNPKEYLRSED